MHLYLRKLFLFSAISSCKSLRLYFHLVMCSGETAVDPDNATASTSVSHDSIFTKLWDPYVYLIKDIDYLHPFFYSIHFGKILTFFLRGWGRGEVLFEFQVWENCYHNKIVNLYSTLDWNMQMFCILLLVLFLLPVFHIVNSLRGLSLNFVNTICMFPMQNSSIIHQKIQCLM